MFDLFVIDFVVDAAVSDVVAVFGVGVGVIVVVADAVLIDDVAFCCW